MSLIDIIKEFKMSKEQEGLDNINRKKFAQQILEKSINIPKLGIRKLKKVLKTAIFLMCDDEYIKMLMNEYIWKISRPEFFDLYFKKDEKGAKDEKDNDQLYHLTKHIPVEIANEIGFLFKKPPPYHRALISCRNSTILEAASYGNLPLLQYLYEEWCEEYHGINAIQYMLSSICNFAAKYNHLDCLKYAYENGCEWTCEILITAVAYNSFECFEYICKNGYEIDQHAFLVCSKNTKFYLFLLENFCKNNEIQYIRENIQNFAYEGNLELLQYFYEKKYVEQFTEDIAEFAAAGDRLDCLDYVVKKGCDFNIENTIELCRTLGSGQCYEYLNSLLHKTT